MLPELLLSPWTYGVVSVVLIGAGLVAASGWSPRRRRPSGIYVEFDRKRMGA